MKKYTPYCAVNGFEAKTKLPFHKRHFNAFSWMKILESKNLEFKIWLNYVHWGPINIVSNNGLAPNRRQAVIWTNGSSFYWHVNASRGLNDDVGYSIHIIVPHNTHVTYGNAIWGAPGHCTPHAGYCDTVGWYTRVCHPPMAWAPTPCTTQLLHQRREYLPRAQLRCL